MTGMLEQTFGLSGRCAVVTGGSRGIGLATAQMLAGCGANVAITVRDTAAGEAAVESITTAGGRACFVRAELRDEASIEQAFASAEAALGAIDIVVNNAAMIGMYPFLDMPLEFFDRMQDVNVRGAYLCMRAAIRRMRATGRGGRIINVSSAAAIHPTMDGAAAYSASKAAMNALTRSAALDFARDGILINAVLPHNIWHEHQAAQFVEHQLPPPSGASMGLARFPLGRAGQTREIASLITFLAGPGASFITGQSLVVDGGFLVT